MNEVNFLSNTDEWETPQDLFNILNKHFVFEFDVCATKENAKCDRFYSKEDDGLSKSWIGTCWMNPPYGRKIGEWVAHAFKRSQCGATVVCLLPARTETRWWHEYCKKGEIPFLKGRLKFSNAKNNAPFPSAIVVFRPCVETILRGTRFLSGDL